MDDKPVNPADVRLLKLIPWSEDLRRCDCESSACHPHGDCVRKGTAQVESYGIKSTVCYHCFTENKAAPRKLSDREMCRLLGHRWLHHGAGYRCGDCGLTMDPRVALSQRSTR